mgnify:CR=1 FL=1
MEVLLEFFEPLSGIGIWFLKISGLYAISYLFIWVFAFALSSHEWFGQKNVYINTYLGWLIPFTLHALLSAVFLYLIAIHYKQLDIPWVYCLPFLFMVLISGILGLNLSDKIKTKL